MRFNSSQAPTANQVDNMACQKNDELRHDLPEGLAKSALRALIAAGYTLKLHGMGPKAIDLIRSALNTRGQSFADLD